jgi:hypothetical protein
VPVRSHSVAHFALHTVFDLSEHLHTDLHLSFARLLVCFAVQEVMLGTKFSQSLGDLPPGLRVLEIGNGGLPEDEEGYYANSTFNWPLGVLPPTLTHLNLAFSTVFNQPLGHRQVLSR